MSTTNSKRNITCEVHACPRGCSVIALGAVSIHLDASDYASLVRLLIQHAQTSGIDLSTGLQMPAGVSCHG